MSTALPLRRGPAPRQGTRRNGLWLSGGLAVLRRLASALLVLFAAATLVFFALQLTPGSVLDIIAGQATSEQARVEAAAAWGLDRPVHEQYLAYLGRLLQGDLGYSYILGQPVSDVILERAPATLELALFSLIFAFVITLAVVILTGTGSRRAARISSFVELVLVSTPSFWLGILLIFLVSFKFNLLPIVGGNRYLIVILPALTLGLRIAGELIQIMRSAIGRTLAEPFTLSARARGISNFAYSRRHALRHAALPVVTVSGWIVGSLLTGTFVVEQLFGRTGVGTLTVKAVLSRDTPVVMGVSLVAAAIYVLVSTLVDILYVRLDPRLRQASAGKEH